MRFLLSRRWLVFGLAVVVLAVGCVRLGEWQFDRLHDREQSNAWVRANLEADPVPVDHVLTVNGSVAPEDEWRRIRARGVYDEEESVIVRYQTRDGHSGVDVVVPLVTRDGTALLVDRGWVETDNTGATPSDVPPPPEGEIDVVAFVRADATGRGIAVEDRGTRAVSSREIGRTLPYPVYAGWAHAESESPPPAEEPVRADLPELGEGPHFFYGLQWWFFGALAVFGFGYLAWDERRRKLRRPTSGNVEVRPVTRA